MSKLLSALVAAIFAVVTVTPVAFAQDKAEGKKTDGKAKAAEMKTDGKAKAAATKTDGKAKAAEVKK